MKGYEYQSDFARKYVAQGRDEGREQGRLEGAIEARTRSVLIVLRARGIDVSDSACERILGEKDLERLERWLKKAVVATSLAEVLDGPS